MDSNQDTGSTPVASNFFNEEKLLKMQSPKVTREKLRKSIASDPGLFFVGNCPEKQSILPQKTKKADAINLQAGFAEFSLSRQKRPPFFLNSSPP